MDSLFLKQSESDLDIFRATTSMRDGSPAEEKKCDKISNGFPVVQFHLLLVNGKERISVLWTVN
jgi:hypothetical protein